MASQPVNLRTFPAFAVQDLLREVNKELEKEAPGLYAQFTRDSFIGPVLKDLVSVEITKNQPLLITTL